jgi:ribosomal protein S18 acetylase RimI-like enzyme
MATTIPAGVTLAHHGAADVPDLLDDICDAYLDSWGQVEGEDMTVKVAAFRNRSTRALEARNYDLVTATADSLILGFLFGYSLRADRGWWDGLTPEPPEGFAVETGERTAVVAEFEVRRAWQGKGLGRAVHDEFLADRPEERATLTTRPHAVEIHALYERWGWRKMGIIPGSPGAYYSDYAVFVRPLSDLRRLGQRQ